MMRVRGHRDIVVAEWLWRVAILAAAVAIGVASQAEGAIFYEQNSDPGFSQPAPAIPLRRPRPRLHPAKKTALGEKEASKPQGPLIISISIAQQKMTIYDANGFFAETPVSTGMPGHSTPMGVFSVIQKHKLHRSNIYSGAPMPYMQRITWSGVAMHAGVLPGRPASHGCIRMPMAFAVKMWNWTKMGARVVITPGEIKPTSFSHPLLASVRASPRPTAADESKPDAPGAAKVDKMDTDASPFAGRHVELRSTLGHGDNANPAVDETRASALQRRTADASYAGANPPVSMSDATPAGGRALVPVQAVSDKTGDSPNIEAAKSRVEPDNAKHDDVASLDDSPAEAESSEGELEAATIVTNKTEVAEVAAQAVDVKAQPSAADTPRASDATSQKPDDGVKGLAAPAVLPESNQNQTSPNDVLKAGAPKIDPAAASRRAGQIAVLVSRKDSKLYVRQNFAPLFEAPVTIAPNDRPLGTHVFTAQVDKHDVNVLHWSVVSLPAPTRYADRRGEDERSSRRRKIAGTVPIGVKPLPLPNDPAEALDRLTVPADAMARIAEALSTGGSIIVSDQGIGVGETGEGTDFIVSLR
jgi:lipoprotein-anchoring transpeptidase ErfK/SrfK